jgi:hypothetical protein
VNSASLLIFLDYFRVEWEYVPVMATSVTNQHPELVGYERPTNTSGAALLLGVTDKQILAWIKEHNDVLQAWKGKTWCLLPSNVLRFRAEVLPFLHHQKPSRRKVQ